MKWTAGFDSGNPSGAHRALFSNVNNGSTQVVIPGGSSVLSEAYGIDRLATILCGYDTDTGGATSQGFVWKVSDASMTLLGRLSGDTDSIAIDVNQIDSNYIAVGSSTGTVEEAVVWDTTGTWDNTGQAKVLTTLLTNLGVDCSDWTRLTRATTMTDTGETIAGYGVWAADGSTRGFIASLAAPPEVETAVSWKNHTFVADFGIDVLNRTGNLDIESRRDGVTKLVVNFDMDIQGIGGLDTSDVSLTSGTVSAITLSASDELTINMLNTLNYVGAGSIPLTVSFPGIASASDASAVCTDTVCIRQLVGNASYTDTYISSSDLVRVRDVMSTLCTADNFRRDIYNDGYFSSSDLVQIRNRMSTYVSGSCP